MRGTNLSKTNPNVLIVTRTRSRPQLLMRAVDSVCAQTFRDFTWVIVNDGGEEEPVEKAAAAARLKGVNPLVLRIPVSRGMEAASNAGVRSAASEFVAIHDDDDSWAPKFLERTTAFLAAQPDFAAVTTHCARIEERIEGSTIRDVRRSPHKPVLTCVHLADMLQRNLFPPISLLYRREVFEAVGGYDESMAVLGDWDFNIKVLMKGEIGVLPDVLANYHVRIGTSPSSTDRNSITPGATQQQIAEAAYRNRMLRRDLAEGRAGLGLLLALSRPQNRGSFRSRFMAWFKK
jgi:glycosyltransferase involved in cell wall biosynthesis